MSPWSSGTGVLLANLLATCGPQLGHELQARPPLQRLWQWPGARPGERPRQLGKGLGLCQGRLVVEVAGFPNRANIPAERQQATASRASSDLGEADASAFASDPRLQYRLLQSAKHSLSVQCPAGLGPPQAVAGACPASVRRSFAPGPGFASLGCARAGGERVRARGCRARAEPTFPLLSSG